MKKLLVSLLLLGLLSLAVLFAVLNRYGLPTEGIHVIVNDREFHLAELSGWHGIGASLAVLLALCAAAIVVPLVLLLGVMLPLLLVIGALALVLALVLGAGALALLPVLLPVLLLIWLWRRAQRHTAARPQPGATIDA